MLSSKDKERNWAFIRYELSFGFHDYTAYGYGVFVFWLSQVFFLLMKVIIVVGLHF